MYQLSYELTLYVWQWTLHQGKFSWSHYQWYKNYPLNHFLSEIISINLCVLDFTKELFYNPFSALNLEIRLNFLETLLKFYLMCFKTVLKIFIYGCLILFFIDQNMTSFNFKFAMPLTDEKAYLPIFSYTYCIISYDCHFEE